MNIRTRLKISNLLMILVPVAVSVTVGALIVATVWWALAHGSGIGVDSSEDFYQASDVVAAVANPLLDSGDFESLAEATQLAQMLDASEMSLVVVDGNSIAYSYGDLSSNDEQLVLLAAQAEGDVRLSNGGRCLTARDVTVSGASLRLCTLGDARAGSEALTKGILATAATALVVVLAVTIAITNRFLTLFVLRHVTDPLDLLSRATRQIRDGDLDYRLPDNRQDEFATVFCDFNDMAARLLDSVERDRRAREKRSTLLVGLSHDLRTPLTSIQAYTEGLLDGVATTPEAETRYLLMVKGKAEEMGALLKRLSSVAKADKLVEEAPVKVARLDELVTGWVAENSAAYALRGVEIEAQTRPVRAVVAPELVARILGNLLDNCQRHARQGDDPCHVRVSCEPDAGGAALLTVDDDGPGVPKSERERIFDLFYCGDRARTSPGEGSGIGLAVVALAAERMGGSARADASPLGGLRVVLSFPLAVCGPEPEAGAGGSEEGQQ